MITSNKDGKPNRECVKEQDIAYLVKTKRQLKKMNKILGTNETVCPALYVRVLGTLIQTDAWRVSYMKNIGYQVIHL